MLKVGTLYVIATPIGNLKDISLRAIEMLRHADLIAAEDTRHSQHLLAHLNVTTPLLSLHAHNEEQRSHELIHHLKQGKNIALITDAGTPLISDPGYRLVSMVHQHNITVVPIPGPCALITALSAAGLPADRFLFLGFLPTKKNARYKLLSELKEAFYTLIFYEAPHRIQSCIDDMIMVFGEERYVVLARELTKIFETIYSDTLIRLKKWLNDDSHHCKGEFVVLVQGVERLKKTGTEPTKVKQLLKILLTEVSIKQAVSLAAKISHEKKNNLYQWALELKETSEKTS